MPLFAKKVPVKAAAASSNVGAKMVGRFEGYPFDVIRARAMSIPTITRSRDLICGSIAQVPLEMVRHEWNGDRMEPVTLAPRSWLARIDRGVPNSVILSWTADDLLFYGRAFWYITERTSDGFPSAFTRMPADAITTEDQAGPIWFGPSKKIDFNGGRIDPRDVVQFISPNQGLIYTTPKAIETAIKLEQARYRNAATSIPAVVLRQVSGEPLSAEELAEMATEFDLARINNQTAAVNEMIEVKETFATPDKMLMIEAANYSALDLCRAAGVPPYLVGISSGSYAYQNSQQSRQDLYVFGMAPIMTAITETLSGDNVLPRGTGIRFDVEDFISTVYGNDLTELAPGQLPPERSPRGDDGGSGEENTQEALAGIRNLGRVRA